MNKGILIAIILVLMVMSIITYFIVKTPIKENMGRLELRITDAPPELEIKSLLLDVSNVQVHYSGNSSMGGEWIDVKKEPMQFDLIELRKTSITKLIGSVNLPPGEYTQIRLDIEKSQMILKDDSSYDLNIPSEELKMIKGFEIVEGKKLILTLDFDAQKSIHEDGMGYSLKPTVKVIPENVDCLEDSDCSNDTCYLDYQCISNKCEKTEKTVEEKPCEGAILTEYPICEWDISGCEIECMEDSDCFQGKCCHADFCVNEENKPDCEGHFCSDNCVSILDCGNGYCGCVNYKCEAVPI